MTTFLIILLILSVLLNLKFYHKWHTETRFLEEKYDREVNFDLTKWTGHFIHHHSKPVEIDCDFKINSDVIRQYRGAEHQLIHFTKNKMAIELIEKIKKEDLIEYVEVDDMFENTKHFRAKIIVVKPPLYSPH